jgi:hypothetical protein
MEEWRYSSTFFGPGPRRRWVVIFTPLQLYPRETVLGTHWIEGWVGSRANLDDVDKRRSLHCRESNSDRPARRCADWPIHIWHLSLLNTVLAGHYTRIGLRDVSMYNLSPCIIVWITSGGLRWGIYRMLGKTGSKWSLTKPRCTNRREDHIKIILKEMKCEDVDWIQLA